MSVWCKYDHLKSSPLSTLCSGEWAKNVHWSKLKPFADYNLNVAEMMEFVFDRFENIVGKGKKN